jgi:beta-glucosidase
VRPPTLAALAAGSVFHTATGRRGLAAEYFSSPRLSGLPAARRVDRQLDFRWIGGGTPLPRGVAPMFSARWTGQIRPVRNGTHYLVLRPLDGAVRCWLNGRLVCDATGRTGGLFTVRASLRAGRPCPLVIEYETVRPPGWHHFQAGWYHADDARVQYREALQAAARADAVVVCTGFTTDTEGEGFDRPFALDDLAEQLILDAAAAHPNVAVVLQSGGGVDFRRWLPRVRSLLQAWYPGQEGGRAVAEILLGHCNPSGKLPCTFERQEEDRWSHACYHDEDRDGRVHLADGLWSGYRQVDRFGPAPLFPFGFGLSYTTFSYRRLRIAPARPRPGQPVTVTFEVGNTGERAGAEVVQLYVGDEESRLPRPVRELKDFRRVWLRPGQWKTVRFVIRPRDLRYFDPDAGGWVTEPGRFRVWIGASSADLRLQGRFTRSAGAP